MTFNCISSGSSGNCYFLEFDDRVVFVDCGVTMKSIKASVDISRFQGKEIQLYITHEHHDHVSGLKPFINKFSPKIFASEGTASALHSAVGHAAHIYVLKGGCEYDVSGLSVIPFDINHDSREPLGYRFSFSEKVVTFATDLGVVSKEVEKFLCCCDVLVLESNYEPKLLEQGKYPLYLKKRIASQKGHLSNKDAVKILSSICDTGLGKVFLAHVSEENNDYELLESYAKYCRDKFNIDTSVLRKETPRTGVSL
ncbi:MBL fold metallo-hydrolase [Seleniivibrio woodruffii]|uniref:Phosphoribosyl 1,2-cyclic phosphodiesterase n=1 Tax=Seleniivibrio woodruffii TaxID=1078050 RepID=A0A4R1KB99_9BACT|nr:MBL fold metallo-hydrolase [Seleniivibrio woodruffii]TCK61714.1 phosphoribosyl 1,2-cyclic phosphodiesterase [Seleniivibrio woodruffii]TVZ35171.1 phosphoribosyl 1,2-cyclic phosphodiesterase [Seleniivibrio woodruffii]